MKTKLKEIASHFQIEGELIDVSEVSGGNINSTYILSFIDEKNQIRNFVFQKINTNVFPEPELLMDQIRGVTVHIRKEKEKVGRHKEQIMKVIETKGNKNLFIYNKKENPEYWRVYNNIKDTACIQKCTSKEEAKFIGTAYGDFTNLTSNYPVEELVETIPNFHNTGKRYEKFLETLEKDVAGRASGVQKEIDAVLDRMNSCYALEELIAEGKIPERVNHNDTKSNNVMINFQTGEYCVIDLDTVMPGYLADPGDGLRSITNPAGEEETDLSRVEFNLDLCEGFIDGYLSMTHSILTDEEVKAIPLVTHVTTLELYIRFLDDYLCGDTYFKTEYPEHNLDRARNQLALLEDLEYKYQTVLEITENCSIKYKGKGLVKV